VLKETWPVSHIRVWGLGLMHPCLAAPQGEAKGHEARPSEELGILVVSRVDP